jgi:hypothetical protein
MLHVSICMCLVSNVTRGYLSVSCVQCYPCLSFCVLCPMLPVAIFMCLVSNVTRVYLSVYCVQCYPCLGNIGHKTQITLDTRHRKIDTGNIGHKTQKDRHGQNWAHDTDPCLSFCVLCPMLPVSICLCLVPNVTRVYLSVSCVHCYTFLSLGRRHRKIDTGNIGHRAQKDRHRLHLEQDKER